jgi:hypothetical protein
MQNKPLPHSHWRHYKSIGWEDYTYEVFGIVFHSETQEEMVMYKMLYDSVEEPGKVAHPRWTIFVRPLAMWYDIVDYNWEQIQRFTQID